MATLTVQSVVRTGLNPSLVAAAGGGDEFVNDSGGDTFFWVDNGGGGSVTVTIASQATAQPGLVATDLAVAVPAGEQRMIGPFPPGTSTAFNDGAEKVQVTYSGVTSVTVAAIKV